tara:strand:- start:105 stop:362 length:258 start_codon:yes stop_codon:yes gene_type:complete
MTLYKCECGKQEEVYKAKIIFKDGNWVADVVCECNKLMKAEPVEGMPTLIRTEDSLSKNKRDDKLWSKAKERLTGDQSYNSLKNN